MKKKIDVDIVSEEEVDEKTKDDVSEDVSSKIKEYVENGKARKTEKSKEKITENKENTYFTKRVFAYLIDILLVSFIASILATPFLDAKRVESLSNQATKIVDQFQKNEISTEEYVIQYGNISYSIAREQGIVSIFVILLTILYFVVYQTYSKGQTLGKKLMKIRVESETDELTINQMIFRSFMINSLLLYIIDFIIMLTVAKRSYIFVVMGVSFIQYIVLFICAIMMLFRKDGKGLHDLVCRTRVVNLSLIHI